MEREHFSEEEAKEVQNAGGKKAARLTAELVSEPKVRSFFFCR